jgi:hypothetical protein
MKLIISGEFTLKYYSCDDEDINGFINILKLHHVWFQVFYKGDHLSLNIVEQSITANEEIINLILSKFEYYFDIRLDYINQESQNNLCILITNISS